ncbi:MAG: cell wall anchor protein [Clostridiales Family XIII bacterium]|jgi:hypothetical protein|nr:cell wall anchor protein [Clostridiales Family XIII bacterium]
MKRVLFSLTVIAALTALTAVSAFAAEDTPPTGVSITVVMPDTAEQPPQGGTQSAPAISAPSLPAASALYPTSVEELRENNGRQIIKTYALSANENPQNISREPFERDGWLYTLSDITKTETALADARDHTETVTVNTESKDMEAILRELAPTLEFTSEDGYTGVLTLNVAAIKVEQAGTKTTGFNVSATREYPHLSSNDTSLIPKTITDGGRTLRLAAVDWRAGNLVTVDYEALPEYYTAVATYTGTGSKTVVTGYTTAAEYSGTIGKIKPGSTVYTAYFLGAEIVPELTPPEIVTASPAPDAETTPDAEQTADPSANAAYPVIFIALAVLLAGLGAGYFLMRKKRAAINKNDEGDSPV